MSKATETASAVNDLLKLPDQDQQSLLEVIQEYFTMPDDIESDADDSDLSDDEMEAASMIIKMR